MRVHLDLMRDNPGVECDPLSDILTLVEARSVVTGEFAAGGAWSMRFRPRSVKFYALVRGGCWLLRDGQKEPQWLQAGDVLLVTDRRPFVLASDPTLRPQDAATIFADPPDNFATVGDGSGLGMLLGHVTFDPTRGSLLIEALPPFIHLRGASPEANAAQRFLEHLYDELRKGQAGSRVAIGMLTQMVFLQALRVHLADAAQGTPGWLRALGDERIAPALRLIHGEPARNWRLEDLARAASMSRSAFALRFKASAGVAPLAYLLNWRMRLAERALTEGETSVSSLAYTLGYTSESAFSNAFKRVVGVAPKRYREASVHSALRPSESPPGDA